MGRHSWGILLTLPPYLNKHFRLRPPDFLFIRIATWRLRLLYIFLVTDMQHLKSKPKRRAGFMCKASCSTILFLYNFSLSSFFNPVFREIGF